MKTVIPMDSNGTLTIPGEIRKELAVSGAMLVELEVADHSIVLRPSEAIPEEDLWAYTPEHLAQLERALSEGDGRQMSEADLLRLIDGVE